MTNTKKRKKYAVLRDKFLVVKLANLVYFKFRDLKNYLKSDKKQFNLYGLTIFSGMQGDGKTISLVEQLEYVRSKYPHVKICTNFGYFHEDFSLKDWNFIIDTDFKQEFPDGICIAIDEIQNEFSVYETRNFNMDLLFKITQQRKSGVKIYGTSQHFTRVAKPLREQTFEVVECRTFFGRWTIQRAFDGQEYSFAVDKPLQIRKLHRKFRRHFVQTDNLRSLFESYAIIDRLKKINAENN